MNQLHPFIQKAYQQCLTSGTITSTQGGYAQSNRFAGLATNEDSDDNTADTITEKINLHMANLTAQTMATLNKQAKQTNVSLQQLAANNAQLATGNHEPNGYDVLWRLLNPSFST
jgi:hypothetical protein